MVRTRATKLFALFGTLAVLQSAEASTSVESKTDTPKSMTSSEKCPKQIAKEFSTGFTDGCISTGGRDRIYRVYQPKGSSVGKKYSALVVVLHGGGGSSTVASDMGKSPLAVFQTLADKDNFLLVYPDGTDDETEKTGWNDCRSDDTSKSGANDVEFLAHLITQLKDNFQLNSSQVFIAGTSNGAMMTFRFAMEKTDLVGGIAGASGNLAKNPVSGRCQHGPFGSLPVLLTHGAKDVVVPTEGGCVGNFFRLKCRRGEVQSAEATVQFWLKVNGLSEVKPVTSEIDFAKKDGGAAVERKYSDGKKVVVSWWLKGAGHATPSKMVTKGNKLAGKQNRDIEFAEVAWDFFKNQINQ